MLFSLVIPTYNRSNLVGRCVEQILRSSGKKRREIELIWIDDGSPRVSELKPLMMIYEPDIVILKKQNEGTVKTKNLGMLVSRGDWICVIDSDFTMSPNWLTILEDYIKKIPQLEAVCFSDHMRRKWSDREIFINDLPLITMKVPLISGAFAFSRSLLNKVGFLDEDFGFYGLNDAEWTQRLKKAQVLFGYIPSIIGTHHGGRGEEEPENRKKKDISLERNKVLLQEKSSSARVYYNPYIPAELGEMWDEKIRNNLL